MAERDILLGSGSNPTVYESKEAIDPFPWLAPIEEVLPALNAEYDKVRTSNYGSVEDKTAAIAGIKTQWLGRSFLIKTFDNEPECDLEELRRLLDGPNEDETPQC